MLADEARKHCADGVICGHIHHAANEMRGGVRYINTGDWVESCTAVVEHSDGRMEIIDWSRRISEKAGQLAKAKPVKALADARDTATQGEAA